MLSHSRNCAFGTPTRRVEPSWERKVVGRNHVASELLRRGHAKTHKHAFERFLEARRVPKLDAIPAAEAVAAIKAAGGLCVLAHPGHHDLDHHAAEAWPGRDLERGGADLLAAGLLGELFIGLDNFPPRAGGHVPHAAEAERE